ncbi:ABC transporter ATP-binding protein [Klebsiella pneumoniae]|nr:ABC transporter ATP-binding protein [Klebsiella pneumoniae]
MKAAHRSGRPRCRGGQKQRVALARALIHRPRLLLLDEPLGALDALTRLEMQELIVSLWQEHGFTVLLVTHDVSEAVAMADRVLLIEEKKIGLDLSVDIPRPRRTGSAKLAELEAEVLDRVMKRGDSERAPRLFSHG